MVTEKECLQRLTALEICFLQLLTHYLRAGVRVASDDEFYTMLIEDNDFITTMWFLANSDVLGVRYRVIKRNNPNPGWVIVWYKEPPKLHLH